MNQTTTIIIGNNAGTKYTGPGSLRLGRAAAKGRRSILKYTNGTTIVYSVWDADGVMVDSY